MWDGLEAASMAVQSPPKPQKQNASPRNQSDQTKSASRPSGAPKGYSSVAGVWERLNLLSDTQLQAIETLASACTQRPLPSHIQHEASTTTTTTGEKGQEGPPAPQGSSPTAAVEGLSPLALAPSGELMFSGSSFEDVVLQNSSEFYRWLSELEAARSLETEGQFQRQAAVLDAHLNTCDELLAAVDETLELFEKLKKGHESVSGRTAALHATCEKLVAERAKLEEAAETMHETLKHFDELETLASQLHAASVDSTDFIPLLLRVDVCMKFIAAHPHYADASTYNIKFRQLQNRALSGVRSKVQEVLKSATNTALLAAREEQQQQPQGTTGGSGSGSTTVTISGTANTTTSSSAADGAETALLYIRYRAAAEPSLKHLLKGIGERAAYGSAEYARLLQDCTSLYCESRLALMKGPVMTRIKSYASSGMTNLLRSGCAYLMQVAQLERQLYGQLFSVDPVPPTLLAPLLDSLCTLLYDGLRPSLVSIKDVDTLCELADILRVEVLEDPSSQSPQRRDTLALLEPVMLRTLADVQERISFRAHAFIREEVSRFTPTGTDLDYPKKLEEAAKSSATAAALAITTASSPLPTSKSAAVIDSPALAAAGGDANGSSSQAKLTPTIDALPADQAAIINAEYVGWYPPVQRALLLLSKLYRSVPQKIFNGLAHEAVAAATTAVQEAAKTISQAKGQLHGHLFAIKQLLVLREQIAPFQADFAVVERLLDFSHMRDYLKRTVSGQLPLFSVSADNALLQLVSKGGPRLQESQLDAKKELERLLKATCEAFIMHVTKLTVEPMLSFITKVTAARVTSQGDKPLREQAFAAADRLGEVVAAVNAALKEQLPEAVRVMKLYLPNPATQGILFKPIKSNIAEAHGQIAALLDSDYSREEVGAIRLTPAQELAALLDGMS